MEGPPYYQYYFISWQVLEQLMLSEAPFCSGSFAIARAISIKLLTEIKAAIDNIPDGIAAGQRDGLLAKNLTNDDPPIAIFPSDEKDGDYTAFSNQWEHVFQLKSTLATKKQWETRMHSSNWEFINKFYKLLPWNSHERVFLPFYSAVTLTASTSSKPAKGIFAMAVKGSAETKKNASLFAGKDEVDIYIGEISPVEEGFDDLLGWWKERLNSGPGEGLNWMELNIHKYQLIYQ
ncbi:hypothetical protein B0H14DRAFT_2572271 [Mycena olivaceomarginata]|nr:hypothetical protein B0H14DRAFT_2572271 [Mycena olivaceomarginata]